MPELQFEVTTPFRNVIVGNWGDPHQVASLTAQELARQVSQSMGENQPSFETMMDWAAAIGVLAATAKSRSQTPGRYLDMVGIYFRQQWRRKKVPAHA